MQKINLNSRKHSPLRTADRRVLITVHNNRTQRSTEQLWQTITTAQMMSTGRDWIKPRGNKLIQVYLEIAIKMVVERV